MKKELEKLGFDTNTYVNYCELEIKNKTITIYNDGHVELNYYNRCGDLSIIPLFKYNHEKVKQLIEILK